jgi:hypothetical protein
MPTAIDHATEAVLTTACAACILTGALTVAESWELPPALRLLLATSILLWLVQRADRVRPSARQRRKRRARHPAAQPARANPGVLMLREPMRVRGGQLARLPRA